MGASRVASVPAPSSVPSNPQRPPTTETPYSFDRSAIDAEALLHLLQQQIHHPEWDNERYFQLVSHENDMINARMTWWLVLQGFMLAGVAFGWEKSLALVIIFASIGIITSLSSAIVLRCATYAIQMFDDQSQKRYPHCDPIGLMNNDSDPLTPFPHLPRRLVHFMFPWHVMPILFVCGWVAVIIVRVEEV